ncbi:MAG: hypothetical protein SVY53_05110 [Chloroflexota bacterium]|nr:hypothetical protein [Chloroflexota bacterium]
MKWIPFGYDVVRYRDLPEDTYFREAGKNEVWCKAKGAGGMVVSCGNGNVRTARFNDDTLVVELEIYEVKKGVTYFKEVWR